MLMFYFDLSGCMEVMNIHKLYTKDLCTLKLHINLRRDLGTPKCLMQAFPTHTGCFSPKGWWALSWSAARAGEIRPELWS